MNCALILACILSAPSAAPDNIETGEYDIVWKDGKTYPVRFMPSGVYLRKHGKDWRGGSYYYSNITGNLYVTEKYYSDGENELMWSACLKSSKGDGKDVVIEGTYNAPFKGKLKISKKRPIPAR